MLLALPSPPHLPLAVGRGRVSKAASLVQEEDQAKCSAAAQAGAKVEQEKCALMI